MKRLVLHVLGARGYAPVQFQDGLTWEDFAGSDADDQLLGSCHRLSVGVGQAWANAEDRLLLVDACTPGGRGHRKRVLARDADLERLYQSIPHEYKIRDGNYSNGESTSGSMSHEVVELWRVHTGFSWDMVLTPHFWRQHRTRRILGGDLLRLRCLFRAVDDGWAAVYVDQRGRFHVQRGSHFWLDTGVALVASLLPQNALVRDEDSIIAMSSLHEEISNRASYPLRALEAKPSWSRFFWDYVEPNDESHRVSWRRMSARARRLERLCRQADRSWHHTGKRLRRSTYFYMDTENRVFQTINGFLKRCWEIEICLWRVDKKDVVIYHAPKQI